MTKEEIVKARAKFSPAIGNRVRFCIPERGGWCYGFGDVIKLNKVSVRVIDRKFPGEEVITVDRGLLTEVIANE